MSRWTVAVPWSEIVDGTSGGGEIVLDDELPGLACATIRPMWSDTDGVTVEVDAFFTSSATLDTIMAIVRAITRNPGPAGRTLPGDDRA